MASIEQEKAAPATDPASVAEALRPGWRDDLELLEQVMAMDAGDATAIPPIMAKLAGDAERDVRESLRNADGVVPVTAARQWIYEVIQAANAKN